VCHRRASISGVLSLSFWAASIEAFRRKLEADLEYIERRKWSTELSIMAQTLLRLNDKTAR
jgi:lipopolysaccharide/colanic/teichoic acid biosynthesis glycosyltransferase